MKNSNGKTKVGFHGGYYYYTPISDKVTFRSGLTYSNLGSNFDNNITPLTIHSINMPYSVNYRINNSFQAFVGGEIGTNFFGELPRLKDQPEGDIFDFTENFKIFDFSAFIGAGYILADNIDFNIKYNYGFTNINNSKQANKPVWKNNWLTVSAGYTFRPKSENTAKVKTRKRRKRT